MVKFYFPFLRKIFPLIAFFVTGLFSLSATAGTFGDSDSVRIKSGKSAGKLTDTRKDKPDFLSTGVKVTFTPYKPTEVKAADPRQAVTQPAKAALPAADGKLLSNVKVYPNPVDDQINVSYRISKASNVTIKLMDLLGNEVAKLVSQKMQPGDQLYTYNIANKLNSGIYYIQVIAGNELNIRRISVL